MNTDDPELVLYRAGKRVREIQAKLHRWARDDSRRRFDDVFNLVCDPAFLVVAWGRVRSNRGGRSSGVDGASACGIQAAGGVDGFLARLRADLKERSFVPLPVRNG